MCVTYFQTEDSLLSENKLFIVVKVKATRQVKQNLINIEMDRPTRMKFLPKKLCDNEKDSKETFQCSYCNSNYTRKASLNTHVKQKHQENGKYLCSDDLEDQTNETQTHKAKKAKVESPVIADKEASPQVLNNCLQI